MIELKSINFTTKAKIDVWRKLSLLQYQNNKFFEAVRK